MALLWHYWFITEDKLEIDLNVTGGSMTPWNTKIEYFRQMFRIWLFASYKKLFGRAPIALLLIKAIGLLFLRKANLFSAFFTEVAP